MATKKDDKWMQNLDIKKGALKAKAAKAGGVDKEGKIKDSYLKKAAKSPNPKTRKQAVLAETFKKTANKKAK